MEINYRVKIRTKGVRNIHWMSKDKTSYKIDIIGDKKEYGDLKNFHFKNP